MRTLETVLSEMRAAVQQVEWSFGAEYIYQNPQQHAMLKRFQSIAVSQVANVFQSEILKLEEEIYNAERQSKGAITI